MNPDLTAAEELAVLPTKIAPPLRLPGLRSRQRLDAIWDSSSAPCVVLTGPAGYGKTSLARQWMDRYPGVAGWVTADVADSDPLNLLRAIVAAFDPAVPMPDARALLAGPPAPASQVVDSLLRPLLTSESRYVLVVDDVHMVREKATAAVLDQLMDATPEGSHVVLAGRSLPPMHMGRRWLSEQVLEIGPQDLAFTREEAFDVVAARLGTALSEESVSDLFARTEGWPAGLQLSMLALRGKDDPDAAVREVVAEDRHLIDYIEEELFAGVSEGERRFLIETSILDRLNGPLCDAVTASSGAATILDRLVRSGNVFVVPLERPGTFRYHHLFRELLQAELLRTSSALEPTLRRRAAEWLVADGDGEGAVRQAMGTGDLDLAAEVVYRLFFPSIDRGQSMALERWLSSFPPAEVRSRALLLIVQAWTALANGRSAELDEALGLLDGVDDARPLPDGTISVAVATAVLKMIGGRGGVKATLAEANKIIDAGPTGSPWWGVAHMQRAVALHLMGASNDPIDLFDAAERAASGSGAVHALALAHCGLVRLQRDLPEGYELVDRAVEELRASGSENLTLTVMVFTVLAYADSKRGRLEAAEQAATRANALIETVGDAIPRGVAHQRLILADAALYRRDLPAAARELELAQAMLVHEPDAQRLHEWADRISRRTSARRLADAGTAWTQLSPAELRVLEQLRTHRSLEEIGSHLYVSRNTVKSHTIAIYRKLGVSGRSHAVDRAVELGLLPD